MKKLVSLLLATMMLLTCIPLGVVSISAAGGYNYYINDGKATIYEYTGSGGTITIPDKLGGYPVTCIAALAFYGSNITSVKMGKNVQYIEGVAFAECKKLTSVTLNSSLKYIGEWAFQNTKITKITIPNSVKEIGSGPFYRCSKLKSITLPFIGERADGSGDTSFGYIFYGDTYIEEADWLPSALDVVLTGDKSLVSDFSFSGCTYLNSITIPDRVTTIGDGAFAYCENLKKVTLGKNVKTIRRNSFLSCSKLTSIVIPDSVTTIENGAFACCENLKSITLGKGVKSIGTAYISESSPAFSNCPNLAALTVSKNNPYFTAQNGVLFNKKKTKLIFCIPTKSGAYTVPQGVTTIGENAFYGCSKLTSITVPDSVTTIQETALAGCKNLKKVSLGKGVKTITHFYNGVDYCGAFAYNTKMTTLTVSKNNPYFTVENGVLFNKKKTKIILCLPTKTGTYVIPNGVTTIGEVAFEECKVKSVVMPTSVKTIEMCAFSNLEDTYYTGTKTQANRIEIDYGNFTGDWHYNTCKTHKYTNACDKSCNKCDWVRTTKHTYKVVATKKATPTANGKGKNVCSVCGYTSSKAVTIYKANKVTLSKTSYTYNGIVQKPTVTVKDAKGKTISSSNYTVTYASGRKNVGTYKVTIKMKGNYTGTKTITFKINPVKTSISKLTAATKALTVKWAKKTTQVTGYEIQYSTSKSFSSYKTKSVSKNTTTSLKLTGLSAKKTYYVRVRTYKTVNGVKIYSGWTTVKSIKTK